MKQNNSRSPKEAAALPHLSTPFFTRPLVLSDGSSRHYQHLTTCCLVHLSAFLRQLGVRDATVEWGERIMAKETLRKQLDESVKDFQYPPQFLQIPQGEEVQLPVSSHLGTSKRHPDAHVCSE